MFPVIIATGVLSGTLFFQKTGAVAGTFTAVGVVGLIILIVLISTGIRRRRAKKFDQEIAEAAREAAATQPPVFLDDDDDDYRSGPYGSTAYGAKGGPYSDVSSHGTYNQPAMVPPESFGMREMPPGSHGPAPGEVFDYGAAAAGAAGIGVARARSQNNGASYGQGLQEGGAPYAAFNMPPGPTGSPPPPQYHYNKSSMGGSGAHGLEVLEAAGMGAHVAGAGAALARGPSQYQAQGDGYQQDGLTRKKSLVSHEGEIVYPTSASTAGQAYYSASADPYAGFNAPQQQQGAYGGYEEEDAYGGYVVSEDAPARTSPGIPMPSPYDAARHPEGVDDGYARHGEDAYDSVDEEDEPKRVLKVANE
ncbi:hypothetical protein D9611_011542 [Ephemerocybe angulata]|uniref:Uncharacterized protein n=1 Tax=Ephemerocybe angulata TaxID=980116 RepID=A0A8H5ET36_9AGAR|nr:hypothetical protein D9611_011542 [Tulosesus angulatus]